MYDFHDTLWPRPPKPEKPVDYRVRAFAFGMLAGIGLTVLCALAAYPVIGWLMS